MRTLDALILLLKNLGIVTDGTIFAGTDVDLPPGEAAILSIAESGGPGPIGAHNTTSLRQPNFQITSRGGEYPVVAALADQAFESLGGVNFAGLSNVLVGDVFFLWIRPVSELFSLPNDANGRVRVAFNVTTCRR